MSQGQIARDADLSDVTVRRIERGEPIEFSVRTFNKLCDALQWTSDSIDEIVAGREPKLATTPPATPLQKLTKRVVVLEDRVRRLMELVDEDALRAGLPGPDPDDG